MRDFFALAFDHFGDREVLRDEFQNFTQQNDTVHDLFDWIDFAARRGQITFGKLVKRFDRRELGGITMRIRQTSKNRCDYRFFLQEDELIPSHPRTAPETTNSRGSGDVGGKFSPRGYTRGKFIRKNKSESELLGADIRDRKTSPNIRTSPPGVFCSTRAISTGLPST